MSAREIWITTSRAAELLDVTERTVQVNAQSNKYRTTWTNGAGGNGGRKLKIALSSLPVDAQRLHVDELRAQGLNDEAERASRLIGMDALKHLPEWNRATALERLNLILGWEAYLARHDGLDFGRTELMERYCARNGVSARSLRRYITAYGKNDVMGLATSYGSRAGATKLDEKDRAWIRMHYLVESRPDAADTYESYAFWCMKNQRTPASPAVALRYIRSGIREEDKIRFRGGEKAFKDQVLPYIERDPSKLRFMEWIVSDHHQFDIACSYQGRTIFPWATIWQDVRTRKVVGWFVMPGNPNSDTIQESLRKVILRFGAPENTYQDNGKDYRAKLFAAGGKTRWDRFRVSQDEKDVAMARGLFALLGITAHYAEPYNAQAKLPERTFATLKGKFSKAFTDAYRGGNVQERPESLEKHIREGKIPSFEDLRDLFGRWVEEVYNERPQTGTGMDGRSPNHVANAISGEWEKRTISEDRLVLLLTSVHRVKRVRNGIQLSGATYRNDLLITVTDINQPLLVRRPTDDISKVYAFTGDGSYVGEIPLVEKAGWGDKASERDFARRRREIGLLKRQVAAGQEAARELVAAPTVMERLKLTAEANPPEDPQPAAHRLVHTPLDNAARAIKRTAVHQDFDPGYLEALAESAPERQGGGSGGDDEEYLELFEDE